MSTLIRFPINCPLDQDISQRIGVLADKLMGLIETRALPNWMIDHITGELASLLEQWSAAREGRPVNGVALRIRLETLERLLAREERQQVCRCMSDEEPDHAGNRPRPGMTWVLAILVGVSVFVFLFVALPLALGAHSGGRTDASPEPTGSAMVHGAMPREPAKLTVGATQDPGLTSFSPDLHLAPPLEMPLLGYGCNEMEGFISTPTRLLDLECRSKTRPDTVSSLPWSPVGWADTAGDSAGTPRQDNAGSNRFI